MNKMDNDIRRAMQSSHERFSKPYFGDYDGDGVPNILDCRPTNRHKQGFLHDWLDRRKGKLKQQTESPNGVGVEQESTDDEPEVYDDSEQPSVPYPRENELEDVQWENEQQEKKPSSKEIIEEEYFINDEGMHIYEPIDYLQSRYGVPRERAEKLTMLFGRDSKGRVGAFKYQLDDFGKEYKEQNANLERTQNRAIPTKDYLSKHPTWEKGEPINRNEWKEKDLYNEAPEENKQYKFNNATSTDVTTEDKGVSPPRPEGFYNPAQKGRFGGSEGEIYLYVKTSPTEYSLFETPFNSRVDASRYVEENFKGTKFITMSRAEAMDYKKTKEKEEVQRTEAGQRVKAGVISGVKTALGTASRKAEQGGWTGMNQRQPPSTNVSYHTSVGGPSVQSPRDSIYRETAVSSLTGTPNNTPGMVRGVARFDTFRPQLNVGKKVSPTKLNAPFAHYTGPHFTMPHAQRGRPYQKLPQPSFNLEPSFKLYRPKIYGSREPSQAPQVSTIPQIKTHHKKKKRK